LSVRPDESARRASAREAGGNDPRGELDVRASRLTKDAEMRSTCKSILLIVLMCLVLPLSDARAQRTGKKAPPPSPITDEGPPPPDLEKFAKTYEKAGDPRILVLAGRDTLRVDGERGERAQQQAVASGRVQPGMHLGARLDFFDETGDPAAVKTSVEELLQQADIRLVSLDALAEADRRELELAQLRDEDEVISLLGTKTNAELIIVIRMQTGPSITAKGAHYRVFVEAFQPTAGRKITGFMFDCLPSLRHYT
jgi:hypothetical protein